MKNFLGFLFIVFSVSLSLKAQEMPSVRPTPIDSLPDLWIVTLDQTGSMTQSDVSVNLKDVSWKLNSLVSRYGNTEKDAFVLQGFGADKATILNVNRDYKNYSDTELVSYLIHDIPASGLSFEATKRRIQEVYGSSNSFRYDMSFTALIRPLSVYSIAKNGKIDFSQYRNIYSVLITDNGDSNDQWMRDYNWSKKYIDKHFVFFTKILPMVASSEFDFSSRKSGKFNEIETFSEKPFYFMTQYVTYEEKHPSKILAAESLVEVSNFHDNKLTLEMKPCGDSIAFVYVKNCFVNGHPISVNQYLYYGDTIPVGFDTVCTNTFNNKVSVDGTYQELYTDRILGQRYRTVPFSGKMTANFITAETKNKESHGLKIFAALLLAIIAFAIIWRNLVVLSIFVNGKCYSIRRKMMKKLKNDSFTLLTVHHDEKEITNTHFFKGKGISVEKKDVSSVECKVARKHLDALKSSGILVKSFRRLTIVSHDIDYEDENGGKVVAFDYDLEDRGGQIQISYTNKLSHNLVIQFLTDSDVKAYVREDNPLMQLNNRMLASSISMANFDEEGERIAKPCNNVLVNIIHQEVVGGKSDYAILNIFDYNSRNLANRIFLRYSLVCYFHRGQITEKNVAENMIRVARFVLKSEKLEMGTVRINVNDKMQNSDIEVDVSPMLTYLYLVMKGKGYLAYSPFADGRQPLADGRLGLSNKTVKVIPNTTMTLLNLPFKYSHPEMKVNGPTTEVFDKVYRTNEVLTFLGNDKIKFHNVERDWSLGVPFETKDGKTYRSWSLDTIIDDSSNFTSK